MKLLAAFSSLVAAASATAWDPDYDDSLIGHPTPKMPVDPEQKAAYFVDSGYVFALNQVIDGVNAALQELRLLQSCFQHRVDWGSLYWREGGVQLVRSIKTRGRSRKECMMKETLVFAGKLE